LVGVIDVMVHCNVFDKSQAEAECHWLESNRSCGRYFVALRDHQFRLRRNLQKTNHRYNPKYLNPMLRWLSDRTSPERGEARSGSLASGLFMHAAAVAIRPPARWLGVAGVGLAVAGRTRRYCYR
jgi:hypothetical protein